VSVDLYEHNYPDFEFDTSEKLSDARTPSDKGLSKDLDRLPAKSRIESLGRLVIASAQRAFAGAGATINVVALG
jgi:hypothetical protein